MVCRILMNTQSFSCGSDYETLQNLNGWNSIGLINDPDAVENFKLLWKTMITQKMAVVCFKNGSNEIAGLNMNCVICEGDRFLADVSRLVSKKVG